MKKLTVLFDFDGTVIDSFEEIVAIVNKLAHTFGFGPIGSDEIVAFRREGARSLIRKLEIPLLKIPFVLQAVQKELGTRIVTCKPVQGIPNTLNYLHKHHSLGIITSNTTENVSAFLKSNKLHTLFDFVYTSNSLFGKATTLGTVVKKLHIDVKNTVYIGDEIRDVEAAKKVGITSIAVTWGFNNKEGLLRAKPDYLVTTPQELIEVIHQMAKW
ncbi:HAD-IA family hydrolase [Candidatus Roizmanbacteria bacterium]|nr:HAD-IA family hydrolase [Candidatus Roizmanbacteria bacterium]